MKLLQKRISYSISRRGCRRVSVTPRAARDARAMALIETLIYMSLFLLVSGMAFGLFYRVEEQSRFFRRSTDDISAVLKAGERWRSDVRLATAPPQLDATDGSSALRIVQKSGTVRYFIRDGGLWREAGSRPIQVLSRVAASAFVNERRDQVSAWRWEVELPRRRHQGSLRPLFTFIAVPQTGPGQ